jgi:hypothetical protein
MERIRNAYEYSNYKPVEQAREVKKKKKRNWSSVGEQKADVCRTMYKLSDLQIILMKKMSRILITFCEVGKVELPGKNELINFQWMQAVFVMTAAVWECDKMWHCTEFRNFTLACSKVVLEVAGGQSCCIILPKKGIFSFVIGQVSKNLDCLTLKIKAP